MASFTRKAIMDAFIRLLEERPLSRITVKDVVEACGVNRNTFYYHFEDIPSLIEAIIREDTARIMQEHTSIASIEEALQIAVDYILRNRRAALHIFRSGSRDIYEHYLMEICRHGVETYFAPLLDGQPIDPTDREIIIRSYRCWCFGLFVEWLDEGLREDIQPKLRRLCEVREGMAEETIRRCRLPDGKERGHAL